MTPDQLARIRSNNFSILVETFDQILDSAFRYLCTIGLLVGGIVLVFLLAVSIGHAQDYGELEKISTNIDSYLYFAEPGEGTVEVKVMGTVRSPGLYRLGVGTNLGQLLALSGGPVLGVRQEERDRETTVRLFRQREGGTQELIFERGFEEGIASESATYPELKDGDIMTIEVVEDRQFQWRDALSIISAAGTVAFAISRFAGD